jgi:DNA polymerase delta subunit 1
MLADRMGKRDPGNKPSSNDRIPFVYVQPPKGQKAPEKQGDRIETPSYIRDKNLKIDHIFYITNQIAKPVAQVFGLVVDQLPGVKAHQLSGDHEKLAEELLFGDLLRDAKRDAAGQMDLRSFFGKKA